MDAVPFHVGITTGDLDASRDALSLALGVSWTPTGGGDADLPLVGGGSQPRPLSCISREGPVHIDLIQGAPGTIWDTGAPAIHHFAYWTDSLEDDVDRLAREGWRTEMTFPGPKGEPTVFAYMVRNDGFRLELIDRAGRASFMERLES